MRPAPIVSKLSDGYVSDPKPRRTMENHKPKARLGRLGLVWRHPGVLIPN